jgi:hypothetical protein
MRIRRIGTRKKTATSERVFRAVTARLTETSGSNMARRFKLKNPNPNKNKKRRVLIFRIRAGRKPGSRSWMRPMGQTYQQKNRPWKNESIRRGSASQKSSGSVPGQPGRDVQTGEKRKHPRPG